MLSLPAPPFKVSLPKPPKSVSFPTPPTMLSLPAKPNKSMPAVPVIVTVSLPARAAGTNRGPTMPTGPTVLLTTLKPLIDNVLVPLVKLKAVLVPLPSAVKAPCRTPTMPASVNVELVATKLLTATRTLAPIKSVSVIV